MQTERQPLSTEQIREFVIAGQGNLQRVKEILSMNPQLLSACYQRSERDRETAIQAVAQVGSVSVAEFLLEHGAPLEICTAAMLGRRDEVKGRLDADPENASAVGAHGIPLLPHAVWSGNLDISAKNFQGKTPLAVAKERNDERIVQLLKQHGATD